MSDLTIQHLDTKSLSNYESWFDNRATANMLFKQSEGQDLSNLGSQAWSGSIDGQVVAVAFFSTDIMHHGHFYLAVKQSERRHGYGTEMMKQVLSEPIVRDLVSNHVTIEPENVGAQKILRKTGFVQTGYTSEGYLEFEKL